MERRELRCPLCCQTFVCSSEAECEAHIANCSSFHKEYGNGAPRSGLVAGFADAVAKAPLAVAPAVGSQESTCFALASLLQPIVPLVQREGKPFDEAVDLVAALAVALVQPPAAMSGSDIVDSADFGLDEMWASTFGPYLAHDSARSLALQAAVRPAVEAVRCRCAGVAGEAEQLYELLAGALRTSPSSGTKPADPLPASDPGLFAAGQRVSLHGLKSRPSLNGAHATVLRWEGGKARYAVEFTATQDPSAVERLLLRPDCLQLVTTSPSAESDTKSKPDTSCPAELADVSDASSANPAQRPTEGPVAASIRCKLAAAFAPTAHLDVINESSKHNVPPDSETHFKVVVVSACFAGVALLERHRRVNDALVQELRSGVHALSIVAKTPEQWAKTSGQVAESPPCLGGARR